MGNGPGHFVGNGLAELLRADGHKVFVQSVEPKAEFRAEIQTQFELYGLLAERVAEKRRELRRRDFTTEATDEVCSEGHPMVIRLGRNGRFLACSLFPEHKESRPLPGDEPPPLEGTGETCPFGR